MRAPSPAHAKTPNTSRPRTDAAPKPDSGGRSGAAETWRLPESMVRPWLRAVRYGQPLKLAKGATLYDQGQLSSYFYLVQSGRVRISMLHPNGAEFILEVIGPGAMTGEAPAFDGMPHFSSAVVAEDAEFIRFDARKLDGAFREDPELAISLQQISAAKQRLLAARAHALTLHDHEARVCQVLLRIGLSCADPDADGCVIDRRITHQQIADMTGVSRVTVTRVLGRLRRAGVVNMDAGAIAIREPKHLPL